MEALYTLDTVLERFVCKKCNRKYKSIGLFNRHILKKHYQPRKEVEGKIRRKRRKKSELAGISFTCEVCGKSFSREHHLERHRTIHSSARPFKCEEKDCDASYKAKEELNRHKKEKHSNLPKPKCERCGKEYSGCVGLKAHMKWCVTTRGFKCQVDGCEKDFKTRWDLNSHSETHNPTNSFICDLKDCNKEFKSYRCLLRHWNRHLGDWQCHKCEIIFNSKDELEEHNKEFHSEKKITSETLSFVETPYKERN